VLVVHAARVSAIATIAAARSLTIATLP
jgi:hypothetical protein